jgi:hypothetical protein
MNAEEFVRLMSKLQKTEKAFSIGTVGSVSGNKATIQFDGEGSASSKYYPSLAPYSPVAGHRVLVANIAGTHVILGQIQN